MTRHLFIRSIVGFFVISALYFAAGLRASAQAPLALGSARITIAGTSNVHAFSASTTTARVTRAQLAPSVAGAAFWDKILSPGSLQAFEIAIPAAKLASDKEGLDTNMHKALKVEQYPDITFRLVRLDGAPAPLRAIGMLKIAGVEREVALDLRIQRKDTTLTVKGEIQLLMTDFGIAPPKVLLGMLKTDPRVTVTFETYFTARPSAS